MAAAYKAKGSFASGTGNVAPGLPAGLAAGDLMLLFVHSANEAASAPDGWSNIPAVSGEHWRGTPAAAGGVRLDLFYRWWQSGDSAPTVADTGNITCAIIQAYSGVDPTTPFDGVTPIGFNAAASTTLTANGITTATADALVVHGVALDRDAASTSTVGTPSNGNLSGLAERHDQTVSTAQGGGLWTADGLKASAGASGNTTATQTSNAWAGITLSLRSIVYESGDSDVDVTDIGEWVATDVGGGALVSGSFTPPANSLLVASASYGGGIAASNAGATVSGGELTWTRRVAQQGVWGDGDDGVLHIWTAPVGSSPSSMTVTSQTAQSCFFAGLSIAAVEGHDADDPIGLTHNAAYDTVGGISFSLPEAPAVRAAVIVSSVAIIDRSGSSSNAATPAGGWTELADQAREVFVHFSQVRDGLASPAVAFSFPGAAGSANFWMAHTAAIEIKAAAPPEPTARPRARAYII